MISIKSMYTFLGTLMCVSVKRPKSKGKAATVHVTKAYERVEV